MKALALPVKITHIKEQSNKTIIQLEITGNCKEDVLRYSTDKGLTGELRLDDGKQIAAEQRKKLYATFKDISDYTGYPPEYTKELFKFMYCAESGQEYFSLSDCSMDAARELINYIIEFVIENDIPLTELAVERTDDIGRYLAACIRHGKCCCCSQPSNTYTLPDKTKIALCSLHYDQAKAKGLSEFQKLQHVYGINFIG